jgi:hypothetical protein
MGLNLFAASRVRRPRLRGLLAVLRRGATWRTVWRFAWLGPLVGALLLRVIAHLGADEPPAMSTRFPDTGEIALVLSVTYLIGGPPALVAGLLFGTWYHGADRPAAWSRRAALGALAGLGAAAAAALALIACPAVTIGKWWAYVAVIALLGAPAAVVLALLQRAAPVKQEPAGPPPGNPTHPLA